MFTMNGVPGDIILGLWLLLRRRSLTASTQGVVVDQPVCGQPPNDASCNVRSGHALVSSNRVLSLVLVHLTR